MREQFYEALSLLRAGQRILISSHINPDGDAIGSALALARALRQQGKEVTVALQDTPPTMYRFLPDIERVQRPPIERSFDLVCVVDCENPGRVGRELEPLVRTANPLLVIDHHLSNQGFGTVEIRDPLAAATGEIIALLLEFADWPVDPAIAQQLMTAIIIDTGSFRYSNVTPRTLRVAADLLERGAHISEIIRYLYEDLPLSALKLLGIALRNLQITEDGKVVYSWLSQKDFSEAQATEDDTEGIARHLLTVANSEIALLFRETPSGTIRVSLRSREGVDVNRIARTFGGGGHSQASGCTLKVPLESAVEKVVAEARRVLSHRLEPQMTR